MVSYSAGKKCKNINHLGLNPCCSGQWSRTFKSLAKWQKQKQSLNPYCSGQWSRTNSNFVDTVSLEEVLILIVVEDGLVHYDCGIEDNWLDVS